MVNIRVNFVLLLQDDFTGNILSGTLIEFTVNGVDVLPIRKSEGFYIFTNLTDQAFDIHIRSDLFLPADVHIHKEHADQTRKVRLYRSYHPAFSDCKWLRGKGESHAQVFALTKPDPAIKLQMVGQSDSAQWISIQGYATRRFLNRWFCVGEENNQSLFIISSKQTDGTYLLETAIDKVHRQGEAICRVYTSICDKDGIYAIPVELRDVGIISEIMLRKEM